jgi:hypothetical protein
MSIRSFTLICGCLGVASTHVSALVGQRPLSSRRCDEKADVLPFQRRLCLFNSPKNDDVTQMDEIKFDEILRDDFEKSIQFLETHPNLDITRDRFQRIFDAIEDRTRAAEDHYSKSNLEQEVPIMSQSRIEMTKMYNALKDQGHLRLFGCITRENMPASGSHTVRPSLLEEVTLLSMRSLTPKPSNTLLYAGIALATVEAILSITQGWDINLLFFASLIAALADRVLLNGALSETVVKILSPETQAKITRHEAGHFLCAYLLGCPVEVRSRVKLHYVFFVISVWLFPHSRSFSAAHWITSIRATC